MFYVFVILGNFPTKMFAILASITRNGGFLDFASRIYGESTHWVSSNTGTTIAVYKVYKVVYIMTVFNQSVLI